MVMLLLMLCVPWLLALLHTLSNWRPIPASRLNAFGFLLCMIAAVRLALTVLTHPEQVWLHNLFYLDALNAVFLVLTTLVATTTAYFAGPYMLVEMERGRLTLQRLRLFHAVFALLVGMMLICLSTNHLGLLWVALEAATLSAVLMVGIYRTASSFEAAWKYFVLGGIGIIFALFGIILIYLAANRVRAVGGDALLWNHLWSMRSVLQPSIMAMAFVFTLVGFGTKAGLVPWHSWLPDAHAEGPTPISAVLSGLLLNVALYALLRCKVLVEGALHAHWPSQLLMGVGILSALIATLRLREQTDIKRLFSYSSVEHMGLISFGMGLEGSVAHAAALLQLILHALIKSSIFFAVGHAVQKAGDQQITRIRGVMYASGRTGWGLILGTLAITGFPPFGLFRSELLLIQSSAQQQPWALPLLAFALIMALAGLLQPVQNVVWGDPLPMRHLPYRPFRSPMVIHLGLALVLGIYLPPLLWQYLVQAAQMTCS